MVEVTPFTPAPNPLTQLQGWQSLTNSALVGRNLQTQNKQIESNLSESLSSQLGRASLAHALYGEQTPQAYRDEIDRQVQLNPKLAAMGEVWKSKITDDMQPAQLRQMATQHASALLDPTVQVKEGRNGQIQFINNGATNVPVTVPGGLSRGSGAAPQPSVNGRPIGGGIVNEMTPGDKYSPGQPMVDTNQFLPDGTTPNPNFNRPISNLKGQDALNSPMPPGATPAPANPLQPGAAPPVIIRTPQGNQIRPNFDPVTGAPLTGFTTTPPVMPPGARPDGPGVKRGPAPPPWVNPNGTTVPPATQAPPVAPAPAPQPTTRPLSLSPTESGSIAASAQRQLDQRKFYASDTADVQRQTYNTLNNLLPNVNTGPGTDTLELKKAVLATLAPSLAKSLGIDTEVTDRAIVEKNFAKLAGSGAGSDARLAIALSASPSGHIDRGAAMKIVQQQLGNIDMERALHFEHDDETTMRVGGYDKAIQAHRPKLDVMAFAQKYMPQADVRKYYEGLSDAGKHKFHDSSVLAMKYQRDLANTGEQPATR